MKDTRFIRRREKFPRLDNTASAWVAVFFLSISVFLRTAAAVIVLFALKELFS